MSSTPVTRWVIVSFLPATPANVAIERLREKYDPLAGHIHAHVTLVHPFVNEIDPADLRSHVGEVARRTSPFRLVLDEVTPTLDGYLFLNVKVGNDAIVCLRDQLYEGVLARHKSRRDTFVPHVTVGRAHDAATIDAALADASELDLRCSVTISAITAYAFDDAERRVVQFEIPLGR